MLIWREKKKTSHLQFNCEICVWGKKLLKSWNERRGNNDREAHAAYERTSFFRLSEGLNCQKKRTPTATSATHKTTCKNTSGGVITTLHTLSVGAVREAAAFLIFNIIDILRANTTPASNINSHSSAGAIIRPSFCGHVIRYQVPFSNPREEKNDWLVCWDRKSRSLRALFLLWGGGAEKKDRMSIKFRVPCTPLDVIILTGKEEAAQWTPIGTLCEATGIIGRFPSFPADSLLFPRQDHQVQRCIWIKWMWMWEWVSEGAWETHFSDGQKNGHAARRWFRQNPAGRNLSKKKFGNFDSEAKKSTATNPEDPRDPDPVHRQDPPVISVWLSTDDCRDRRRCCMRHA